MAADDLPARPSDPVPGSLIAVSKPVRRTLVAVAVVTYAWVAAAAAPFSTRALIGVLIPGAVLGAIAYGRPPERIQPPDAVDITGLSYWIVAIALLFEWEASAFRDFSDRQHPSLTDLISPMLGTHEVKSAAFVIWLAAGWALVKR